MLVRSDQLSDTMSRYLVERVETNAKISLYYKAEIETLEGESHLERVQWRDKATGELTTLPIRHVFMMTGASPNTTWLKGCLALDDKGFVLTDRSLTEDRLDGPWADLGRRPLPFETSRPGLFAVGDLRSGSTKRVATAVGEGSAAVRSVHDYLAFAQP